MTVPLDIHVVRLVAQLCPTLCDPKDCTGSSVHADSLGKNTEVGCYALLQGIFPTQGLNTDLPHCRWILYCMSHQRSPYSCSVQSVQSFSHVQFFATPWTVACQASLSITVFRSFFKLMSIRCLLNSILFLHFYFYFGKSSWVEVYFMSKIVCSTDL